MVGPDLEGGLKRAIVRGADALNLIDVSILRIGADIRPLGNTVIDSALVKHTVLCRATEVRLVDIQKAQQPASFAAYIADLKDRMGTESLLNLQAEVEVIRSFEMAVHGEDAARICGIAQVCCGGRDHGENVLSGHNGRSIRGKRVDRVWTAGITLKAVGRIVARPVVKERIGIGGIEEHAESAAHDGFLGKRG